MEHRCVGFKAFLPEACPSSRKLPSATGGWERRLKQGECPLRGSHGASLRSDWSRSGRAQIACSLLSAFGYHLVADLLAFDERTHAGALDRADVDEHVLRSVGRLDKSEALLGVEKLHGTGRHHGLL